ncbi:hypothetical protein [Planosporangium flavigriseum]
MLGENRIPTAQDNARAAVSADRQRAQERAELERWLANVRQRRTSTTP